MSTEQISADGGGKKKQPRTLAFSEEFELDKFTTEFINEGPNSKMFFKQGSKSFEVNLIDGFTLEVSGKKLVVKSYAALPGETFVSIDFRIRSAMLIIAPNGGGIGIADIRDQNFRVFGYVFDVRDTLVSVEPSEDGVVVIHFNDGYDFGEFSVPIYSI